ncbi:MAG: hypothetical protein ACJAXJ_004182 [Colwellia sp.]|jgi:hypothetical protein
MIEEIRSIRLCIDSEDQYDNSASQVNIEVFIENHKSLLSISELQAAWELHRAFGSLKRNTNKQKKMDEWLFTLVQYARDKT